jgi:hypothetical protein
MGAAALLSNVTGVGMTGDLQPNNMLLYYCCNSIVC